MVQQQIQAFRNFASQLATQVVEQMCTEYEREMSAIWNDACMYRAELERVEQLLGMQLEREKKLHGTIEEMLGHSNHMHEQCKNMASQSPGSDQLKQWVDQFTSQNANHLSQTVAGVSQANQVLNQQAAHANGLKQESISAEHEFVRIANLLKQPLVTSATPSPTVGVVPGSVVRNTDQYGSMAPGSGSMIKPMQSYGPPASFHDVRQPASGPSTPTRPMMGAPLMSSPGMPMIFTSPVQQVRPPPGQVFAMPANGYQRGLM